MNVFELSAIACPLAGAIAGGVSVRASGAILAATGIGLGLVLGLVCYFAAIGFNVLMSRLSSVSTRTKGVSPLQSLASVVGVFLQMASPFAAWVLSAFVISRLLQL